MYTKYKVNLIIQLGLDIKDSVQLGLSQNNAPWVHPGSHMWRNHVCCATLRTCILRFADFFTYGFLSSTWPRNAQVHNLLSYLGRYLLLGMEQRTILMMNST